MADRRKADARATLGGVTDASAARALLEAGAQTGVLHPQGARWLLVQAVVRVVAGALMLRRTDGIDRAWLVDRAPARRRGVLLVRHSRSTRPGCRHAGPPPRASDRVAGPGAGGYSLDRVTSLRPLDRGQA